MANGLATWSYVDRVVVVTDACSLRGSSQVAAFQAVGATVFACDSQESVSSLASTSVETVTIDLSVESDVVGLVERISARGGRLDVLVINDPVEGDRALIEVSDADWQRLIARSVTSGFLAAKHLAPLMFKRRYGRVLFTTGPESTSGVLGRGHVCASRHAIVGLAKDLAIDAAPHQVSVNVVAAGQQAEASGGAAGLDAVTHTVLWLASDAARFITGSVLAAEWHGASTAS